MINNRARQGGFAAKKYIVDGTIGGERVAGTLRFEPQTDALVRVEIHTPAALVGNAGQDKNQELRSI